MCGRRQKPGKKSIAFAEPYFAIIENPGRTAQTRRRREANLKRMQRQAGLSAEDGATGRNAD